MGDSPYGIQNSGSEDVEKINTAIRGKSGVYPADQKRYTMVLILP
jgi:hypothetical protein